MAKNAAQKQGMVTEKTTTDLSFDKVMEQVQISCGAWNKTSLKFVAACTAAFLTGAYATDDNQRRTLDQTRDALKVTLRGANIGKSQTYNYIDTALSLARAITKNKANGVLATFVAAPNALRAIDGLFNAIETHAWLPDSKPALAWNLDAEKKPIFSIDVLRVNLGLDNIVKFKADGLSIRKMGGARARGGSARKGKGKDAVATQASPDSVIKRLETDHELQAQVSEDVVIGMASSHGRDKMVERLVSLMTLEELTNCQKHWKQWVTDRTKALASENAKAKAKPAKAETTEAAAVSA